MKSKNLLAIVFAILVIFITSCKATEEEAVTEIAEEQAFDTGALVVESSPDLAQVYISEEYKGDTPVNLYNLRVGQYRITVKKAGYTDFEKTVTIKVGRTEQIDVALKPVAEAKSKTEEPAKVEESAAEMPKETTHTNKINISSFAMYYDVDKKIFTELRTDGSDLFSRSYNAYLDFVAMVPSRIRLLEMPLKEVAHADCLAANGGAAKLYSGQTLCVISGEGAVFALSGTWTSSPSELEIVSFG